MTKEDVDQRYQEYQQAREAGRTIKHAMDERKAELWQEVEELEKALREQLKAEFDEQVAAVQTEEQAAYDAWNAAKVAAAEKGTGKYPIGTILHEWKRNGRWLSARWKKTGRLGRIEVITPGAIAGRQRYTTYDIGDLCIRVLKKNGVPAMAAIQIDRWEANNWLPDGESPKEKSQS